MKRYAILALALVLGCTVFTGCRRRDGHMETVHPTTRPTMEATTAVTTEPTTHPATEPMVTTVPHDGNATEPSDHNATDGGMTDGTEAPAPRSRAYRPDGR